MISYSFPYNIYLEANQEMSAQQYVTAESIAESIAVAKEGDVTLTLVPEGLQYGEGPDAVFCSWVIAHSRPDIVAHVCATGEWVVQKL